MLKRTVSLAIVALVMNQGCEKTNDPAVEKSTNRSDEQSGNVDVHVRSPKVKVDVTKHDSDKGVQVEVNRKSP